MPFDVMQREHRSITGRELSDCLVQRDPVDYGHRVRIFRAFDDLDGCFSILGRLLHAHAAFAEVHEHLVDRQPVQPSGEGGLSTKTADFSKELYEDFLREVFSLRDVAGHTQTERIDAAIMTLV